MIESKETPVIVAQANFNWVPPEGGPPGDFIVSLYSTGVIALAAPPPYNSIVTSLEWSDEWQAIRDGSGFWSPNFEPDRKHLLLKATNALRRALGLPLHDATARYPGTEV